MGFFGTYAWDSVGRLTDAGEGEVALRIDIHDSDVGTIDYRPAGGGSGRCYVGYEPREYFDDPTASQPSDADAEAQALATWARVVLQRDVASSEIRPLLAESGSEPDDDFVEDTVRRLLRLLDLPLPGELAV